MANQGQVSIQAVKERAGLRNDGCSSDGKDILAAYFKGGTF